MLGSHTGQSLLRNKVRYHNSSKSLLKASSWRVSTLHVLRLHLLNLRHNMVRIGTTSFYFFIFHSFIKKGVPSAESSCSVQGLGKGVSGKPYPSLCNARRPRLEPGTFRSQAVRLYRLHQARPFLYLHFIFSSH